MCDKCVELDGRIARYRWIASMITDQLTLDRIEVLIANLNLGKHHFILHKSKSVSVGGPGTIAFWARTSWFPQFPRLEKI